MNRSSLKDTLAHAAYRFLTALRHQYGLKFTWVRGILALAGFVGEYRAFRKLSGNPHFKTAASYLYPCLTDHTEQTPVEPVYFFQDTWAARKIFVLRPAHHFDVGSHVTTIGIISQFVPVTMIDLRPLEVELENLHFQYGSILELPFTDESITSLSSLCVIEHIGLGRYGDPLDPWGSEKAAKELQRVLQPNGHLLISVPVDGECRVYFNAHRTFTRQYIIELFDDLKLLEERYIYGARMQTSYEPVLGFGTGLFHFQKTAR